MIEDPPLFDAALYDPPRPELPLIAILFHNGKFLSARSVSSRAEGAALIVQALRELPIVLASPAAGEVDLPAALPK